MDFLYSEGIRHYFDFCCNSVQHLTITMFGKLHQIIKKRQIILNNNMDFVFGGGERDFT